MNKILIWVDLFLLIDMENADSFHSSSEKPSNNRIKQIFIILILDLFFFGKR